MRKFTKEMRLTYPSEFNSWRVMHYKCSNPNHKSYSLYGARGIKVCRQWYDFAIFLDDMGPRPKGRCYLESIDKDADFSPENCRWLSCSAFVKKHGPSRTHGMKNRPEYSVWRNMRRRCYDPKDKGFRFYGARGITVCKRWLKFENFFEDMGPRPKDHTLDRINGFKGYSKENCRWATQAVQSKNKVNWDAKRRSA